ncbi:hypothetical protein BO82DRAFT_121190 [Aspergillus uvarum CBS 121591]|uniref:Uncharacterized protein n=1 Tax=Aspergillus uvarum CBS 121591 TaxID=1448315 RepID=A0A319DKC8_9EURO|nr:hypothetical protein BO82DRAFT_121190 [Aspergillus uvarum CBS 121591]PYH79912.1 hypothetical protein BO82DRAFT_121190 [Aspergillus uvarum CBS 121591]
MGDDTYPRIRQIHPTVCPLFVGFPSAMNSLRSREQVRFHPISQLANCHRLQTLADALPAFGIVNYAVFMTGVDQRTCLRTSGVADAEKPSISPRATPINLENVLASVTLHRTGEYLIRTRSGSREPCARCPVPPRRVERFSPMGGHDVQDNTSHQSRTQWGRLRKPAKRSWSFGG